MLSKKENDIVIFILILILIITLFVISTKLKEETNKNPSIKKHIIEKKMNEGFENECPINNNISSQIDRDTLTLTILNDCISSDLIKKNNILKITGNTDQFTYFKIDDIDYNDNPNVVILKQNNLYTNINDINNKLQTINVTNVELMGTSDNCILTNKYKFSKVIDNLNIKYKLSIYDDFTDVTKTEFIKTEFIKMVKNIFNYEDLIEIYLELEPSKSYLIENIDTLGTINLNNINITSDTNSVNSTSDNKNILLIKKDINKQLKTKIVDDSKSEYITYLVNNLAIENIKNQINKLKDNNL